MMCLLSLHWMYNNIYHPKLVYISEGVKKLRTPPQREGFTPLSENTSKTL